MKYLFFFAALLSIPPLSLLMVYEEKWMRWVMLGLTLPLISFNGTAINFFSNEFYRGTSRGMEISFIYIISLAVLIALTALKGKRKLLPDFGCYLYLIYFLCCLPSLSRADNLLFSSFELWKMLMMYLVFLAVYHYLEFSHGDIDIILFGIIGVVAVNFLTIVLQHFQGVYQVNGLFPHQNSLAMYMLLIGLILFSRYFNCKEYRKSRLIFLAFVMASAGLVRTYSRGALVCYPLGGALTLLMSLRYQFSVRKVYIILLIGMIGMIGLAIVLPRVIERFEKAPESSGETRKNLAIAAVNMMKDVPMTGVGINNWGIKINPPYEYSRHREEKNYKEDYRDGIVETIYLLVGAECGIPGLLMLLLWFGYYWITAFRLLKKLRHSAYFYFPAGALGGLTGIFVQSTLEWVLKQQINFMLLVMVFAILSYLKHNYRELAERETPTAPIETAET